MTTARLEVTIETADAAVSNGGQLHVRGTVRREGGDAVEFVGWLTLLALLEQALDAS